MSKPRLDRCDPEKGRRPVVGVLARLPLANWWRRVAVWCPVETPGGVLGQIDRLEPELLPLAEDALRRRRLALRYRAQSGEPLNRLLPEAFALVREATRRVLKIRHFPVQLPGGYAMRRGG